MVKGNLTEVRDLGMMVNRLNSEELIDHCILTFTTEKGKVQTYPLTKGCHASSRLGKIIKTLLGRGLTKQDFTEVTVEDETVLMFDSDVLLGKEAYLEISEGNTITGVYEAAI